MVFSFGGRNLNSQKRPEMVEAIISRLKAVRESLSNDTEKLTQEKFGEMIGKHRNTAGRYERGLSVPDIEVCANVCTKFGVSPRWLFLGEGNMFGNEEPDPTPNALFDAHTMDITEIAHLVAEQQSEIKYLNAENRRLYEAQVTLLS